MVHPMDVLCFLSLFPFHSIHLAVQLIVRPRSRVSQSICWLTSVFGINDGFFASGSAWHWQHTSWTSWVQCASMCLCLCVCVSPVMNQWHERLLYSEEKKITCLALLLLPCCPCYCDSLSHCTAIFDHLFGFFSSSSLFIFFLFFSSLHFALQL